METPRIDLGSSSPGAEEPRNSRRRPGGAGPVLAGRLEKLSEAPEKNAARVAESHDPDALHDLRVATRRLRAALELAAEVSGRKKAMRLRRELRRLGRALGEMREADVNAAMLREETLARPPSQETAREALLAAVIAEARRLREQVLKRLKKVDIPGLVREIRSYADSLRESRPGEVSIAGFGRPAIEQRRLPVLAAGETSARKPTPQNLHLLRIAAKKFRYTVELLSPAFEPRRGARIRARLKVFQDLLGRYHDCVVLHSEIRRRRSRLRADGLKRLDRELGELQRRIAAEETRAREALMLRIRRGDLARLLESVPAALRPEPPGSPYGSPESSHRRKSSPSGRGDRAPRTGPRRSTGRAGPRKPER